MTVCLLEIENFRGVAKGRVAFSENTLLVGAIPSVRRRSAKRLTLY